MAEIIKEKETIVTEGNAAPVAAQQTDEVATVVDEEPDAAEYQTVQYVIYFFFGVINVLLLFRFVLKLLGASQASAFVNLIYGVTGFFVAPFEGIFRNFFNQGVETSSVFEPATITAIVVYAFLSWAIVKLIHILSGKKQVEE